MKNKIWILALFILSACASKKLAYDASGTFEGDEIIVSSEVSGQILALNFEEGEELPAGKIALVIDSTQTWLKKKQVEAQIKAAGYRIPDIKSQTGQYASQIAVLDTRIDYLMKERQRINNMLKDDAATPKQLDDITQQLEEARRQRTVYSSQKMAQSSALHTQSASIRADIKPLFVQIEQLSDQLNKTTIVNPEKGIVLTRYVNKYEIAQPGKPLYKIANMDTIILRAYFTGDHLYGLKTGKEVSVMVEGNSDKKKTYIGTIEWISSEAEFTPKTIQTADERANLVYAVKIRVPNDGHLKLGMYADVKL